MSDDSVAKLERLKGLALDNGCPGGAHGIAIPHGVTRRNLARRSLATLKTPKPPSKRSLSKTYPLQTVLMCKPRLSHKPLPQLFQGLPLCKRYLQKEGALLPSGMTIFGYARVSTDGQSVDAQVKQLRSGGAEKIFRETASGAKTDRRAWRAPLNPSTQATRCL